MNETVATVKAKITRKHKTPTDLQTAIEKHERLAKRLRERYKKETLTIKIDLGSWFLWYLTKGPGVNEIDLWQEHFLSGLDIGSKLYNKRMKTIDYIRASAQENAPESNLEPKNHI